MRTAPRVDANHGAIRQQLEAMGCVVRSLAGAGSGIPDLLCYWKRTRTLFLVEVKDGSKYPSQRRLTPDQVKFHQDFEGVVHIVESVAGAIALLKRANDA